MRVMLKRVTRTIEGITHVPATLRNLITGAAFTTDFLLDPTAKNSIIAASELIRIGVEPVGKRTYELPNGEFEEYEHGYAEISFLDEITIGQFLFGPEHAQPVLGLLTLTAAGIVLAPKRATR